MNNRILSVTVIALLFAAASCSRYPHQAAGTRPLPPINSYFTVMPLKNQVGGGITWIMDEKKQARALFKGQLKDSILDAMSRWLDSYVDEGEDSAATPVVLITATDIRPTILLTRKEWKALSKSEKNQIAELSKFRTYDIQVSIFTYLEGLDNQTRELYHLPILKQQTSTQKASTKKSSGAATKVKRS